MNFLSYKDSFKINSRVFKLRDRSKYPVFIIVLLLLATIFTNQSLITLNSTNAIDSPDYNSLGVSSDGNKLAFVVSNPNGDFLLIKTLNDSRTQMYSLCQSVELCLNSQYASIRVIQFTQSKVFLYAINFFDYLNNPDQIFGFDLIQGKLVSEVPLKLNTLFWYDQPVIINSTIYYGYFTETSTYHFLLQLIDTANNNLINLRFSNSINNSIEQLYLKGYSISPDLSKLVIYSMNNILTNDWFIDFYSLVNNSFVLTNSHSIVNDPNKAIDYIDTPHVIYWSNDSSTLDYSYSNSAGTYLLKFNFQTNETTQLGFIPGRLNILSIDSSESNIITRTVSFNQTSAIYSIKNGTAKLALNLPGYVVASDNSLNNIFVVDNNQQNLEVMAYKSSSNKLSLVHNIIDYNGLGNEILSAEFFIIILLDCGFIVLLVILLLRSNIPPERSWLEKNE